MLKELIKLANHLDQKGHRDLADRLDGVIKMAQEEAEGTMEVVSENYGTTDPKDSATSEADDADDEALDWSEASDSRERINKLAELMSGEFSTYVPGTFSR